MPGLNFAFLSVEYPPDPFSAGIGSYTKSMANALTSLGHKVHVITRGEVDSIRDEQGVTVHRLTPKRPALPQDFELIKVISLVGKNLISELQYRRKIAERLKTLIATEGLDLIEAADFMAEGIFYPVKRYPQIPFVVRLHTPFAYAERIEPYAPEMMRQAMRQLERKQLLDAHYITAPSEVSAEIFREELNLGSRPIKVMPNLPSIRRPDHLSEPTADNKVLFVGRLNKWKGTHILTRAIPKVLEHFPNTEFIFVGADHVPIEGFPNASSYLKSLVPESCHSHMQFVGRVPLDEVEHYLKTTTLCVFPSLFDNFPYTCLEAMTYGKAIIGSDQGGMVDLLDEGKAGLLYTPPSSDALAKQILDLLANPQLRQSLGAKALTRANEVYSYQAVLDETLQFYVEAIEKTKG
ncbi:MAG: glycosyltransferase family 4 protein [Trueperaceae bacterium]|nr:glycosyltransferase family 4 protein [Trueperaceae bacterium]